MWARRFAVLGGIRQMVRTAFHRLLESILIFMENVFVEKGFNGGNLDQIFLSRSSSISPLPDELFSDLANGSHRSEPFRAGLWDK